MCDRNLFRSVSICLLVVLALGMGLLGCATSTSPAGSVSSWIKAHALPLATTNPQASLDDLRLVPQLVGTTSIVGLGEETHGSHEFFTMKQRLLEFLVEKMGFTLFAMECSVSAGQLINTYVLTGKGNARDLLIQLHEWPWQTQEVLDLLDWMRSYNADPSHPDKVRFAGFDPQGVDTITYDDVLGYMRTVDPQRAGAVASLYRGLRPNPGTNLTHYLVAYGQLSPDAKELNLQHAQQVHDLLAQQQVRYEARSSARAFAQVLQEARVIVQFAQLMSSSLARGAINTQQRDAFMAENAAWLHDHAEGGQKLVLWAHNGHIQTVASSTSNNSASMGMYLRQRYHSAYLAVGMSFYQGAFHSVGVNSRGEPTTLQTFTIQAPDRGSYNAMFGQAGLSLYVLDLRHLPPGPAGTWLTGPHPFLTIGALYASGDWPYVSISLPESFDVVIHIQKVTASSVLSVAS